MELCICLHNVIPALTCCSVCISVLCVLTACTADPVLSCDSFLRETFSGMQSMGFAHNIFVYRLPLIL